MMTAWFKVDIHVGMQGVCSCMFQSIYFSIWPAEIFVIPFSCDCTVFHNHINRVADALGVELESDMPASPY